MSHLAALFAAALAPLLHRAPAAPALEQEPVPLDWLVLETRWDCQRCAGVQPAVVKANGFRCLTCQTVTITTYA
jgi:hypothetical protein